MTSVKIEASGPGKTPWKFKFRWTKRSTLGVVVTGWILAIVVAPMSCSCGRESMTAGVDSDCLHGPSRTPVRLESRGS